jgi:uncharacterized membrane protein YhaH (DUF805 family)
VLHLFTTTGRLRRRAYFWRVPVLYLLAFACYGLPVLAETQFNSTAAYWQNISLFGIAICLYLAVTHAIKRLHDIEMRGWWLLLCILPITNLVLGCGMQFIAGTIGPNRFGPDPKQPVSASEMLSFI